ncbi:transcriptional regulator [Sinorhizobium medicae]|jgi:DNA-binding transcriptional regulator YdaS (Cro superfamily)|uniref:transcriptional regulator n=1 Tax=Sinorhizobium medicae TaxID=110321 RepID=UPI00308FDFD2|nr:Cro/CI family transcriptional regulator [Sinorhizobium medicae]
MRKMNPLEKAIKSVGSSKELARRVGVSPQAISQWNKVPANRVLAVERASGVHRSILRPDLYPIEVPIQPTQVSA